MIRNEPWEPAVALHEMQQQLKTLNDENKQQWYDRTQHNAGTPPLWLGFYDPEADPGDECEDCDPAECVDYTMDAVTWECGDNPPVSRGPYTGRFNREDFIGVCTQNWTVQASNSDRCAVILRRGSGSEGQWIVAFYMYDDDYTCEKIAVYTSDNCLGPFVAAESNHALFPPDISATEVDCDDPPPPTGTSSGTGSGTSETSCSGGTPWMWYWNAGLNSWFAGTTGDCPPGCVQTQPSTPGDYNGEVRQGTCEPE